MELSLVRSGYRTSSYVKIHVARLARFGKLAQLVKSFQAAVRNSTVKSNVL